MITRCSVYIIISVIVLLFVCIGVFVFIVNKKSVIVVPDNSIHTVATTTSQITRLVIGKSLQGRDIESYTYGNGKNHVLFVGGMHGGYEWNSILLAYQVIDYIKDNTNTIPKNVSISIIPNANPDGLYSVTKKEGRFSISDLPTTTQPTGTGRFNANDIDLNRNFDCKWQPKSTWQNKIVNAGSKAFSEPESRAIRDYVSKINPSGVVFWHSKANAVYASQCQSGILSKTLDIMKAYSDASGYTAVKSFDAYETTGAADDWLASISIPAITVELKTRDSTELKDNLAGVKAILNYYQK